LAPADYLSLVVEVAIAIAGFSGIAFALGYERTAAWTELERLRFNALITTALLSLGAASVALLLLAIGQPEPICWAAASGVSGTIAAFALVSRVRNLARVLDRDSSGWPQFVGFSGIGAAVVLALLTNAVWLHAFWPLAVGVTFHLFAALVSFVGLITPPDAEPH
jgi:hypothetical protein